MVGDLAPLFPYMRRYRWGYVRGTLACVCTNIVAVQFPNILGMAVDAIKKGTTREHVLLLALLLVGINLVKGVFMYAQRWILIGISRDIEFDLRNDLFRKLETQDTGFYQRYRTGDIMARMTNDLNAVRMLLGPGLMYSANTIFMSVFALVFMLHISPWLTLVALAPTPLASIFVQYVGSIRKPERSRGKEQNVLPVPAHTGSGIAPDSTPAAADDFARVRIFYCEFPWFLRHFCQ